MILSHLSWGRTEDPIALLVHGASNAAITWTDVGRWLGDRGWHAIAVDLRGHGDSTLVDGCGRSERDAHQMLSGMASDLLETAAELRPGGVVDLMIGHSLGTLVGLVCSVAHPSFARRLVLEDPPSASCDYEQVAVQVRADIEAARSDPDAHARALALRLPFSELEDDVKAKATTALSGMTAAADIAFVPALMAMLDQIDIVALAARCPLPTLLLVGRDAEGYSTLLGEDRARFRAALRDARVCELDTGHFPHVEALPAYLAALADWLYAPAAE